jgi:hypothetical protein
MRSNSANLLGLMRRSAPVLKAGFGALPLCAHILALQGLGPAPTGRLHARKDAMCRLTRRAIFRLHRLIHWISILVARTVPISVVETPEFLSATRKLMNDDERTVLVEYLAYNPTAGDLIPGTGGVRKLRWGLDGRGKRGGARVIYFHHNAGMPLFALTAFAKNERADLSQQDCNDFRQSTTLLVETFKRRKR